MPRHRRGWAMQRDLPGEERHSPLMASLVEPVLLLLLEHQPRHGYTLFSDLQSMGMGSLHQSVVYRTLRDMEYLQWIVSDWDTDQTQGPPRRTYRLTEIGKTTLENWRSELVQVNSFITEILKMDK